MLHYNGNTLGNHNSDSSAAKQVMSKVYGKESEQSKNYTDAYYNEAACERRARAKMAAMGITPHSSGMPLSAKIAIGLIVLGVILYIILGVC
jgi:hypothetical protein